MKTAIVGLLLLVIPGAVCAGLAPGDSARGYVSRACGLDMDRDGTPGETADCMVCDATVVDGKIVAGTIDPDGDGQPEGIVYVDCDGGEDCSNGSGNCSTSGHCGQPGNPPCRTITYAYNTVAPLIGGTEEDIVCFTGVCAQEGEEPSLEGANTSTSFNGDAPACPAGSYQVAPSGNQVRSFCYPHDPSMIVGWDTDADRAYPPHDPDDNSVIDGSVNNYSVAFGVESHMEWAHFEVKDYGDDKGTTNSKSGFIGRVRDHNYYHDIVMHSINDGTTMVSGCIAFEFFGQPRHSAIENLRGTHIGGYFIRGAGGDGPEEKGPLRFQNIELDRVGLADDPNGGRGRTTMVKLWGFFTGVEVLDSINRCDLDNWPGYPDRPCGGVQADVCSQDWDVINNEFVDNASQALLCQGDASGFCEAQDGGRAVDDVNWERNLIRSTSADCRMMAGTGALINSFGDEPNEQCRNVRLVNNVFQWDNPLWEVGFAYLGDYDGPEAVQGTIEIINNTFYGPNTNTVDQGTPSCDYYTGVKNAFITLGQAPDDGRHHANWVIKNNVFAGTAGPPGDTGGRNIWVQWDPGTWSSDGNVFDPNAGYTWQGTQFNGATKLSDWQSASGGDAGSTECTPDFVSVASHDLHLADTDTCATDRGKAVGVVADIDGDPRPLGASWDAGADERPDTSGGGGGDPPPAPTNLVRTDKRP